MALRKHQQLTVTNLVARDFSDTKANPFTFGPGVGTAQNIIPYKGALTRLGFVPPFQNTKSSSRVWKLFEFKFARDGAPENQLLIFRSDGKIYKRCGGADELEIFPGKTSLSILAQKPSVVSIANRMFVDDGVQLLIWDGWDWFSAGLTAPAAPSVALVGGALTGTYLVCVTAVHIRGGVRIHESTRSSTTSSSPAAQNIRVTQPTLDTRATHWSVYISEITGAGNRMRRAATVAVTSTTTDISANPASTSPFAPERNDKPQASRILFQWKNRLGMGDRTNPSEFWFSAYEEVKGNLNGGPEESVPGRNGTGVSISDLVNNWRLPDRGEALKAGIWHENFAWLFSDRNGYVVQGEGGLLDGRAIRDFFPLHSFPFGIAGIGSLCSTPHGLVILTNDRKLYLWEGGSDVIDIGGDIQNKLDGITDTELQLVEMAHWTGNSRDWLVICSVAFNAAYFFDFSQAQGESRGIWFHYADVSGSAPSAVCVYRPSDQPYLLLGLNNGSIKQFDQECQPSHVGATAVLGSTYLSSTVQLASSATIVSTHISPTQEGPMEAKYVIIKHRLRDAVSPEGSSNPSLFHAVDGLTPGSSTVSMTVGARRSDGSQRAWFGPSGGSKVGLSCKYVYLQLDWTSTNTEVIADGSGREKWFNNQLLEFSFAWRPLSPMSD